MAFSGTHASSSTLVHQIFELLSEHCTGNATGRATFIAKVNAVLAASTLNAHADIDSLWRQTWDKPLYAFQKAHIASQKIDALRAMQPAPLDDFRHLPAQPELLRGLTHYTVKHRRLLQLAAQWEHIAQQHIAAAQQIEAMLHTQGAARSAEYARTVLGAPGYAHSAQAPCLFHAITSVPGFGPITALHITTDLGYPVYKPDRWLLRFAATDTSVRAALEHKLPAGMALEHVTQKYLERHLELVLFAVDHLAAQFAQAAQPTEIIDLNQGFRLHRLVDLLIAKFGMTPESQYGLAISGKDQLLACPHLQQRYPELTQIAQEMQQALPEKKAQPHWRRKATQRA